MLCGDVQDTSGALKVRSYLMRRLSWPVLALMFRFLVGQVLVPLLINFCDARSVVKGQAQFDPLKGSGLKY